MVDTQNKSVLRRELSINAWQLNVALARERESVTKQLHATQDQLEDALQEINQVYVGCVCHC